MNISAILTILIKYRKAVGASLIAIFLALVWSYYKYSQKKIDSLKAENYTLVKNLEERNEYIEKLKIAYEVVQKSKNEINQSVILSMKQIDELKSRLNREQNGKKSIEELARSKPKLIENILNNSVNKTLQCLEMATDNKDCNENG